MATVLVMRLFSTALFYLLWLTSCFLGVLVRALDVAARWSPHWRLHRHKLGSALDKVLAQQMPAVHEKLYALDSVTFCGSRRKLDTPLKSVGLAGCSWLLVFHIGALQCLTDLNRIDLDGVRIWGSSSGSLVGAAWLCRVPREDIVQFVERMALDSEQRLLGPVGRMSSYVRTGLEQLLPDDAHSRLSGRLFVSISVYPLLNKEGSKWISNRTVSEFQSRQDLINVLLASCYIPLYYETPIRRLGSSPTEFCLDGGFTNNCPCDGDTCTISPYPGAADISPPQGLVDPLHRLFPPPPRQLRDYVKLGYDSARRSIQG